ncbi:MAG: hypothetical protein AAFQ07_18490, partial [Chloroflexota bacterium]
MPIEFSHLQTVHKDKIEYDLFERHRGRIEEAYELGFDYLQYTRDVAFPFSALPFGWMYLINLFTKDKLGIASPLRVVIYQPVMLHARYDTYLAISRVYCTFTTCFLDGTVLRTSNVSQKRIERPSKKMFRYGMPVEVGEQTALA